MIKLADFIQAYKDGKVKSSTLIKAAAFKDELEKALLNGTLTKQAVMSPGTSAGAFGRWFGNLSQGALSGIIRSKPAKIIGESLLVGGTMMGLYEAVKALEGKVIDWSMDAKKPQKFQEMLELHPELKEKETRAKLYYEVLWDFSPTVADNPLSAGAYIKQALQYDHVAQGPLPASLSELAAIENNVQRGSHKGESFMTTIMAPYRGAIGGGEKK